MKKLVTTALIVLALTLLAALPAFAGGGMVRGDNAQGPATQVQIQDPPPFAP